MVAGDPGKRGPRHGGVLTGAPGGRWADRGAAVKLLGVQGCSLLMLCLV